jgi:hypothetical protein
MGQGMEHGGVERGWATCTWRMAGRDAGKTAVQRRRPDTARHAAFRTVTAR